MCSVLPGLLSIARALDREQQAEYRLNISARDHGLPRHTSYAELTAFVVDVNDNAPTFQHSVYTANVTENADADSLVATIHASDRDVGEHS